MLVVLPCSLLAEVTTITHACGLFLVRLAKFGAIKSKLKAGQMDGWGTRNMQATDKIRLTKRT